MHRSPDHLDRLAPTAAGLDRRTSDRMKRGAREPDARIDLHGMTAERAHRALIAFVRRSRADGARMALVVTGKGGRRSSDAPFVPEGAGVLRHGVPRWLREPPLRDLIVGVYAAHARHGGDGALYVYLKRGR